MYRWRIGILALAIAALFVNITAYAQTGGSTGSGASSPTESDAQCKKADESKNEVYDPLRPYGKFNESKNGAIITKMNLHGKTCTDTQAGKGIVTGICVAAQVCQCKSFVDLAGKSQPCSGSTGKAPAGDTTPKTTTPTTPKPTDSAAKPSDGGSGSASTPSGGSTQANNGATPGDASGPRPGSSVLSSAFDSTPIERQNTGMQPVDAGAIDSQMFSPTEGQVAFYQFDTPPAQGPGAGDAHSVQTLSYNDPSVGSIAFQPPTDQFSGSATDRPSGDNSFAYDSTFSNAYRGTAESTDCSSFTSCAADYASKVSDATISYAKDLWTGTQDAAGKLFNMGAESAPYDRNALQSIDGTTRAFCDAYGCQAGDSTQLAKAIAGACAQEAGGCDPSVPHPGSDYQGLPQTDKEGMRENANTFKELASNEYIQMSDSSRAQFQHLSDRYDELVAAGKDPRKDPEVGAAMLVAQQFNVKDPSGQLSGSSPALAAANYARGPDGTIDPLKASAVMQTAQICPSCVRAYSADPGATLSDYQAGLLRNNDVSVRGGQPVANSFDAMLASKTTAYGPRFATGIAAETLYASNPSPAFIEPQVAYTSGNLGGNEYPSALAYAPSEQSPRFPGDTGLAVSTGFTAPSQRYSMEGLTGSPTSVGTPSSYTPTYENPPYAYRDTGTPLSYSFQEQTMGTLIMPDNYAPYAGGPTPIFAQGSPAADITGINGGNQETPYFAGQNNYTQPANAPAGPYDFSGAGLSSYGGNPSLGLGNEQPAFSSQQYYQLTPEPSYAPYSGGSLPMFAQQNPAGGYALGTPADTSGLATYFAGDLSLAGPPQGGTFTGDPFASQNTSPVASWYSDQFMSPSGQGTPQFAVGPDQSFAGALQQQTPGPAYAGGPLPMFARQDPAGGYPLDTRADTHLAPYFAGDLSLTGPSYAPYSGGPLPMFARQDPAGGYAFGTPADTSGLAPYFAGNSQLTGPTPISSTDFSNPSFAYRLSDSFGGSNGQFPQQLENTGGSGQPFSLSNASPVASWYSDAFMSPSGQGTPQFGAGPDQSFAGALRQPDASPSFGGEPFTVSNPSPAAVLSGQPSGFNSSDLATMQQADQASQAARVQSYQSSLYDQALNTQGPFAISPTSNMWNRYVDVGAAELGTAAPVGAPQDVAPPAAAPDEPDTLPQQTPIMQPEFAQNLGFSSRGEDVRALQQRLIDEGYLHLVHGPSGYYGALTENAVIRYQADHGILQTGFAGPVTRCTLNGGTYYARSSTCRY